MLQKNDCIQFESRREIETVMLALQEWMEERSGDSKVSSVEELFEKLEVMHMCW